MAEVTEEFVRENTLRVGLGEAVQANFERMQRAESDFCTLYAFLPDGRRVLVIGAVGDAATEQLWAVARCVRGPAEVLEEPLSKIQGGL